MTSEDIREMLETATPGPYYVGKHVIGPKGKSGFLRHLVELNWEDERGKADARLLAASWSLAAEVLRLREKAALRDEADALIAHSRNAEADALRAEVERLREALKLSADRLLRLGVDRPAGSRDFIVICEWADEARAALGDSHG